MFINRNSLLTRLLANTLSFYMITNNIMLPVVAPGLAYAAPATPSPQIGITADTSPLMLGETLGLTITLSNTGTATAQGVYVKDTLPVATGLGAFVIDGGTYATLTNCVISNSVLTCDPINLVAGGSYTVHLSATTSADYSEASIDNTVHLLTPSGACSSDTSTTAGCFASISVPIANSQGEAATTVTLAPTTANGKCLQDAANTAPYSEGTLSCTANDVSVASATNVLLDATNPNNPESANDCATPGNTLSVTANFQIHTSAANRYQIGIYFGTNGVSALTGTCSVSVLPTSGPNNPPGTGTFIDTDPDQCGDITSAYDLYPTIHFTVPCSSVDAKGILALPYCTAWHNSAGSACNSIADAVPETKSKCNCNSGAPLQVKLPVGSIQVIKNTVSGDGTFNFTSTVPNQSNFSLTTAAGSASANFNALPLGNYTVSEAAQSAPWSFVSLSCTKNGVPFATSGQSASISLAANGDAVVCTFTNSLVKATPAVATVIVPGSTVNVGTTVHDTTTVSTVSGYPAPSGTITYNFYSNGTCTGTPVSVETTAFFASGSAAPDSSNQTLNNAGAYSYLATYSGDSNYYAVTAACEPLTVDQKLPTVATQLKLASNDSNLPATISTGTSLYDTATLSGATADAGGTLTYTIYTNNQCTALDTGHAPTTVTVTNGVVPDSNTYTFNTAGTYFFQASYSGDANNSAAVSACTGFTVVAPSLALTKVADQASVLGGAQIGYLLTVTNNGQGTATNTTLSDTLPSGTDVNWTIDLAGSDSLCTISLGVLTCSFGDLSQGQSKHVHITSPTSQSSCANYSNTATVQANNHAAVTAGPATIAVQCPAIGLVKSLKSNTDNDGSGTVSLNDVLTYQYAVTNTGNVALSNIQVSDPHAGLSAIVCAPVAQGATLATGASTTCTATYTVKQSDVDYGNIHNVGTATGTPPLGANVSATSAVDVPVPQNAQITLAKSASPTTYNAVGQQINYTYTITNSGNVTVNAPYSVSDDKTPVSCPGTPATLAPLATVTCTATYTLTQADLDAGFVTNHATAQAIYNFLPLYSNQAQATVTAVQNKTLSLTKTDNLNPARYDHVGQVVTFTLTAKNMGNYTLHNISVSDAPALSNFSCTPSIPVASLEPNATVVCTGTYTVTQADLNAGSVTDTATATSTELSPVTATDTIYAQQNAAISLAKAASPATYSAVGQTINYTYTITNTGNVTVNAPYSVSDDKTAVTCPATPSNLAPQTTVTCTASYAITQADLDAGSVTNHATAHAKYNAQTIDSNQAQATVTAVQSKVLSLTKTDNLNPARYDHIGQVVTFTLTAKNTGNYTLHNISVSDAPALSNFSCTPNIPVASLAPNAAVVCTGTYTVTQADLNAGSVTDTATATSNELSPVTATDTIYAQQNAAISLAKAASPTTYSAVGQTISYNYTITNTGNVTVSAPYSVSDDKAAVSCPSTPATLAPLATVTCTATYAITQADIDAGSVTNHATAQAIYKQLPVTSNQAQATVTAVQSKALSLTKTDNLNPARYDHAGQVVTFTLTAKNTGNYTLHNISVSDAPALDNYSCTPSIPVASLAPNATVVCTGTYTVSQADLNAGSVTDTATATSNELSPVSATDTIYAQQGAAISLAKAASPTSYSAVGQTINYTYTITNTGNVTVHAPFSVTDDKTSVTCPSTPPNLAPLAIVTCTASYTITQADLDAGSVTNHAMAHAKYNGQTIDSNQAQATVSALQNKGLTLTKTDDLNPARYDHVGQVVTYTLTAKNTGNYTLHNISVSDAPALSNYSCTPSIPVASLAPNATVVCTGTHAITQADLDAGSVSDTATATSSELAPVTASDTIYAQQSARITLAKAASPATYNAVGQSIGYTYTITNAGNVTVDAPYSVSDDKTAVTCPSTPATLAPLATVTCTATYAITQADIDAGFVTNHATAQAIYNLLPLYSNQAEATVTAVQSPHLRITKDSTEQSFAAVGEVIHYNIVATNDGNVTLAAVTVTDANAQGLSCNPGNGSALAPNASLTCTATHTVTQADIDAGHYLNTACVNASSATEVCANKDVPALQSPHLTITKGAQESSFSAVGDVIHYSIIATNDGNKTLDAVTVSDATADNLSCSPSNGSTLAPNASLTCTATHTVTQADIDAGHYLNTACADATGVLEVCASKDVLAAQSPHLSITKVAEETSYKTVGDVIHYNIVATNDGNTTLSAVTLSDANADNLSCNPVNGSTLAPNAQLSCTATHTVTQGDIDAGDYLNTACVNAPTAAQVCASKDVLAEKLPHLRITKLATESSYDAAGQVIHYTIVATNDGNTTLAAVTVLDPAVSDLNCQPTNGSTRAPGESLTCTATHLVTQSDIDTGSVANEACVDADTAQQACADVQTPADQKPLMTVKKSSNTVSLLGPQTVNYSYLVTNAGNMTLTGVALADDNINNDMSCPQTTLQVGESMTCSATHNFTQAELDANGSPVAGSAKLSNNVTGTSNEAAPALDHLDIAIAHGPAMTVKNSSTTTLLEAPQTVTYSYLVTNTGNVTLVDIALNDNNVDNGVSCPQATLAVGASMTCVATHQFTQGELDADGSPIAGTGALSNHVTATSSESFAESDLSIPIAQSKTLVLVIQDDLNPGRYNHAGQLVTFTLTATNESNVTLHHVVMTANPSLDGFNCTPNQSASLRPGEAMQCTGTHAITQADLDNGSFVEVGSASSDEVNAFDATDTIYVGLGHLKLVKEVINDNGGQAQASDWLVSAIGTSQLSGQGVAEGDVIMGDYNLSESSAQNGYALRALVCMNGDQVVALQAGSVLSVGLGDNITCVFTNDDIAPVLHLVKKVVNNHGGHAQSSDFTLIATGSGESPVIVSGQGQADSGADLRADTYTLSESGGPSGYVSSGYDCVLTGTNTSVPVSDGQVTLALAQDVTCTVTNSDLPGTLIVTTVIVNDNSGVKSVTDFGVSVSGPSSYPSTMFTPAPDALHGEVILTVDAGTYTVQGSGDPSYTTSYNNCENIVVGNGETATCIITTDDIELPGCTQTADYWKQHNCIEAWPTEQLQLGNITYSRDQLVAIMNKPSGGDASLILAQQLIAAALNVASGAAPNPVESVMTEAHALLATTCENLFTTTCNVDAAGSVGTKMIADAGLLEKYNKGLSGVLQCTEGKQCPLGITAGYPGKPAPTPTVLIVDPGCSCDSNATPLSSGNWIAMGTLFMIYTLWRYRRRQVYKRS